MTFSRVSIFVITERTIFKNDAFPFTLPTDVDVDSGFTEEAVVFEDSAEVVLVVVVVVVVVVT